METKKKKLIKRKRTIFSFACKAKNNFTFASQFKYLSKYFHLLGLFTLRAKMWLLFTLRQRSYLVRHLVPEYSTRWPIMWTALFSSTYPRIRARCRCLSTRYRPCTRDLAQKWAPGPYAHTVFVRSGQSTAMFSLLSACFKMASDRATWGNYVHSHVLGTQSVNTTPLCASTQALVPVWTAP